MGIFRRQRAELPAALGKRIEPLNRRGAGRRKGASWRRPWFEHLEARQLLTTVGVQFQFANTIGGAALSSLSVGQNVVLETFVQDVRSTPHGVFQGWLNVDYNSSLISVNGPITHGSHFNGARASGSADVAGHLGEIGSDSTDATPPVPADAVELFFAVPFHVDSAGTLTLTPSLSGDSLKQFMMFGSGQQIPINEFSFSGTSITISAPVFAQVTAVSTTKPTGTYGAGTIIPITVTFDQAVTVTGTPQLTLNDGAVVNYTSGSGTNTLLFNYTVAAGQNTSNLDYANTAALTLNGGSIKDSSANNANLTLPATGTNGLAQAHLVIDTIAPTVTGVSTTTAAGTYGAGTTIPISVTFSEVVNVTGTPQLSLNDGAIVNYTSGSGTNTLTFNYTVAAGQNTANLDYASISALALSGGTIKDAAANNANLTLPATGTNGLAQTHLVIDTTNPVVMGVSTTAATGTYGVGATIPIRVTFNEVVTVTGTPQLALNNGGVASFTSGSGTNTLTFNYTVTTGQNTANLDYASTAALTLGGGTIKDAAANNANLTLPATGSNGLAQTHIAIDTTTPSVTGVSTTKATGTYGAGTLIPITVTFNQAVTVTGTPQLTLNDGAVVNFSSGSGTSTLTFNYTVAVGQNTANLDYASTSALALNGGTIKNAASSDANLTLPATGTNGLAQAHIIIDTISPAVTGVSTTKSTGTYSAGTVIPIAVAFDQAVTVTGTPQLTLNDGAVVNYTSGSGTSTLTFNYTVAAGQNTANLDYASTSALALNGGTIKDAAANNANLTLPATGTNGLAQTHITIDTTAPSVTGVSTTTGTGTYGVGTVIPITVAFNEVVTVTGAPQLALNNGATASFASGSGTNTLTFNYTVAAGQNTANLDYASTSALTLSGGTIKDAAANNANLTLQAIGTNGLAQAHIAIDTSTPSVTGVSTTKATGTYGAGTLIPISVTFNQVVTVTGTPQLTLNDGAVVNYTSGSGTSTLTFNYTVAAGQNASNLDYASTSALSLNGGTIKNAASSNANLTLPATSTNGLAQAHLVIDTTAPAVTGVSTTTSTGTYGVGTIIPISVTFGEVVIVTGTPQLTLNDGAVVNYTSGSGTNTLTFSYTVANNQNTSNLDYASTSALALNGGTIKDAAANNANLTLPATGTNGLATKHIVISTTVDAVVTQVTTPAPTGHYIAAQVIPISVSFNVPVIVTGTPQLALNAGGGAVANFAGISSNGKTLTFNYVVATGQSTSNLDYTSTSALTLNGGTIKEAATLHDAILTLPATGTNGLAQAHLVIDGSVAVPPTTRYRNSHTPTMFAFVTPSPNSVDMEFVGVTDPNINFTLPATFNGSFWEATVPPEHALPEGYYIFTARPDAGQPQSALLIIDAQSPTVAYDAPHVTNLKRPTLSGTATDPLPFSSGFGNVDNNNPSNPNRVAGGGFVTVEISDANNQLVQTLPGIAPTLDSDQFTWTWSVSPTVDLADGLYHVVATALDNAGNISNRATGTFIVDTVNPTVDINPPFPKFISQTNQTIGGTVADANPSSGITSVSLIIGANAPITALVTGGTWTATVPGTIPDGTYDVHAVATDNAGNVGVSATITGGVVINRVPPNVTKIDTSPALANTAHDEQDSIPITLLFDKPVFVTGTPQLALNAGGGVVANYTSGSSTNTLTFTYIVGPGQNTSDLDYTALVLNGGHIRDDAGNEVNLPIPSPGTSADSLVTKNIVIDTTDPLITIVGPVVTNDNTPTLSGTVSDPPPPNPSSGIASVSVAIGNQTLNAIVTAGNWSVTVPTSLTDGTYTATATATDNAGNESVATATVVIDTASPVVDIPGPFPKRISTNNNSIPLAVSDPSPSSGIASVFLIIDSFQPIPVSLVGGTWIATAPTTIPEGTFDLRATATDNAGNPGSSSTIEGGVTIDRTAPSVLSVDTSAPANSAFTTGGTIQFTVTFNEAVNVTGTPQLRLNNGGLANYTSGSGASTLTFTYIVGAGQDTANLDYVDLVLNGGTIRDANGNDANLTLPTPGGSGDPVKPKNIVIDTVKPTVTFAPKTTNDNTPTLNGTVNDAAPSSGIVNVTVVVNGQTIIAPVVGNTWSVDVPTPLADGAYTVSVTATDRAGNTSATATGLLTIDTQLPVVLVTSQVVNTGTPQLSGTVNDPAPSSGLQSVMTVVIHGVTDPNFTRTINGTVNGSAWTAPVPLPVLPDGAYTITASVTDNANNKGTGSGTLFVDTHVPGVTVNALVTNDNTPTLTGTVSDPSPSSGAPTVKVTVGNQTLTAIVTGGNWSVTVPTALADGQYTVTATATDPAGNIGTGTGSLTVDVVAPTVTVNTITSGDTTPTLTGTILDPAPSSGIKPAMSVLIKGISNPAFTLTITGTATNTTWTATVPDSSPLPIGTYFAIATITDNANNSGSSSATSTVNVTIVAANSSLAGFVFLNPSNDGQRLFTGGHRPGVPNVTLALQLKQADGTFQTVATKTTASNTSDEPNIGSFKFDQLAAGTYQIVETQPSVLVDGKAIPGSINGTVNGTGSTNPANTITNIVVAADQNGTEYNFSELGLTTDNVSKRLFLASTPSTVTILQQFLNNGSSNTSALRSESVAVTTASPSLLAVSSGQTAAPNVKATSSKTASTANAAITKKATSRSKSVPALVDQVKPKPTGWLSRTLASWR
jgi:hypothetical protein